MKIFKLGQNVVQDHLNLSHQYYKVFKDFFKNKSYARSWRKDYETNESSYGILNIQRVNY